MDALATWTRSAATFSGETRDVYRKGEGTGVVLLHEIPGIEPSLLAFAEEIVAHDHTVVIPRLFGTPGAGFAVGNIAGDLWQFCVRREFSVFATGRTSPVAGWLRALARELHAEVGGPGVGVIGLCFTGGFALAMLADAPVVAPVLAEPSLPAAVGTRRAAAARGADLGLDPADLDAVRTSSCDVLGLRYRTDRAVGTRFATLERLLGDRFIGVEFEGTGHATLTAHRQESGVRRVLEFLDEKLDATPPPVLQRDAAAEQLGRARLPLAVDILVTRGPFCVEIVVDRPLDADELARVVETAREVYGVTPEVRLQR